MTASMAVILVEAPADACWGENALLSFNQGCAFIHLIGAQADWLRLIQRAGRRLDGQGIKQLILTGDEWDLERRYAFAQGFYNPRGNQQIEFGDMGDVEQKQLDALLETTHWTRQITNGAPDDVYPAALATESAKFVAKQAPEYVNYHILQGEALRELGYAGLYNVGRGSAHEPAFLKLDYNPTGDLDAPIMACLVGKGITFDSGGYSLKESDMMLPMKSDMGGAAMLAGALALAIRQGLNHRVQLMLCCAENMVSGHAFKLGDILTYRNGISVEVLNTDAEGRLVLADGLLDASATGAPYILDAATLTGAAKVALGRDYNAVFSLQDEQLHDVVACAKAENEKAWALPLEPWHTAQLTSSYADMGNVSSAEGTAGATTAAAFLSKFVREDIKGWVHMDLSASFQKNANDLWAPGGKGHGVRTIARWLRSLN
jgi:PepB aminopeptidase